MNEGDTEDRLLDPIALLAKERFGIDYLFPLQRMAIAGVLDGAEREEPVRQMILFPTGFGKSLCFQVPAILAPGPTLVIYPLLALMNDQKRSLEKRGIACALFRGGMDKGEREAGLEGLKSGKIKIGITNPECLNSPNLRTKLEALGIFHLAIDEAHCVSEWGETFRPSYLELGARILAMKPKVVSAFTATASPQVQKAIASRLFSAEPYSLVTADMDKPNIHYSVKQSLSPRQSILRLVNELPKPLIVFDQSRPGVRNLCEYLREYCTDKVRFYHAGLSREEKEEVERWFMESDDGVLVSTCAYGMGVDKKNIRAVVHFSPPPSVEAYIQEAGRAGRDGKPAEAVLIRNPWDSSAGSLGSKGNELSPVKRDGMVAAEAGCDIADCGDTGRPEAGCGDTREMRKKAFLEYGKNGACRRASLLALMGAELSSPCSGCDVCDGRGGNFTEGMEELQSFFRHNRFRFTQAQSLRLLGESGMGMAVSDAAPQGLSEAAAGKVLADRKAGWLGTPPSCPAAGVLASWRRENRSALLNEALHKGLIIRGPWWRKKKRLGLAPGSPHTCP